jgi:hypothetical protein
VMASADRREPYAFMLVSDDLGRKGMNDTYLHRLYAKRAELEAKLELYEARDCFGDEEIDDGTDQELREKLSEISSEIDTLERSRAP